MRDEFFLIIPSIRDGFNYFYPSMRDGFNYFYPSMRDFLHVYTNATPFWRFVRLSIL